MQRRKLLVGLGSLAAGTGAAIGAGALTESSMRCDVRGSVAGDSDAPVAIDPNSRAGDEERLSYHPSTGELYLNFGRVGSGGAGLKPDATNRFDVVFTVENRNSSGSDVREYVVWFDAPSDRLNFYVDSQRTNYIESKADGARYDPDDASPDDGAWNPVPVGVEIDLRGSGLSAGDRLTRLPAFDGSDDFTLHVDEVGDGGTETPE